MLLGDPWWGAVVLVRKHAPALNIRRTVRHHTGEYPLDEALPAGRGGPEPFDGVAEVWFDSKGALTQATATPEGKAGRRDMWRDDARLIDQAHSPLWIGEEVTFIEA